MRVGDAGTPAAAAATSAWKRSATTSRAPANRSRASSRSRAAARSRRGAGELRGDRRASASRLRAGPSRTCQGCSRSRRPARSSGASTSARRSASPGPPARWLSATITASPRALGAAGGSTRVQLASAPTRNGVGAPASASRRADSSSRRTSRSARWTIARASARARRVGSGAAPTPTSASGAPQRARAGGDAEPVAQQLERPPAAARVQRLEDRAAGEHDAVGAARSRARRARVLRGHGRDAVLGRSARGRRSWRSAG